MGNYNSTRNSSIQRNGQGNQHFQSVDAILTLLGRNVVLLPVRHGTKKPIQKNWQKTKLALMSDAQYLQQLERSNVGVLLGEPSAGLCTIDIDDDSLLEPFFESNPRLRATLCTRGKRGCNVWVRIIGNYPRTKKLTTDQKRALGEFRSTGSQTVISGTHPDGCEYSIVHRAPPLEIQYTEIRWPESIRGLERDCTERDRADREVQKHTEPTEITEATRSGIAVEDKVRDVDHAVELALPKKIHENHNCLFTLARATKSLEQQGNRKMTQSELEAMFGKWYEKARPLLRQEQGRDEYWFEFLQAYENAKYPLGEDRLRRAWTVACEGKIPTPALRFESREIRSLVALCQELQRLVPGQPFYLSSRTVQKLFSHKHHTTAASWLAGLVRSKILKVVERGGPETNKATRYRYCPPLDE
jgi:hypothetical protein